LTRIAIPAIHIHIHIQRTYRNAPIYTTEIVTYDPSLEMADGVMFTTEVIEDESCDDGSKDEEVKAVRIDYVSAQHYKMNVQFIDQADAHSSDMMELEAALRGKHCAEHILYIQNISTHEHFQDEVNTLHDEMLTHFINRCHGSGTLIAFYMERKYEVPVAYAMNGFERWHDSNFIVLTDGDNYIHE